MSAENQALLQNEEKTDILNAIVNGDEAHKCPDEGDCNEHPETILNPCLEIEVKKKDPKLYRLLTSVQGVLAQQALCLFVVALNAYEVLAKGLAPRYYKNNPDEPLVYNFSTIQTMNAVLSILLGLILAFWNKTQGKIFCVDYLWMQVNFIAPAILFSIGQSLSYLAQSNVFFPPDVAKVLDQARLLMMAFMSLAFFGKMPSRATWNSLIVITFAACAYTMTAQLVSGKSGSGNADNNYNYPAGICVVLINCGIMCLASAVAEMSLKAYKKVPFYIQKICIETPTLFWLPLWDRFVGPALDYCIWWAVGDLQRYEDAQQQKADKAAKYAEAGMFAGFVLGNTWLWVLIVTFCAKSYLNGVLVKQLSSVVKQICQTTGMAVLYFLFIFHDPLNNSLSAPMVVADLLVFFAVIGYALSTRDKSRKNEFKNTIAEQKKAIAIGV